MTLSAGTRLGPYEILSAIGAGGMGEVYRARDTRLNRTVAVKVLPSAPTADPDGRARFKREAEAMAALNHPYSPYPDTPLLTVTFRNSQNGLPSAVRIIRHPSLSRRS